MADSWGTARAGETKVALFATLAQYPPHPRAAENATSCRISCMTRILRAQSSHWSAVE